MQRAFYRAVECAQQQLPAVGDDPAGAARAAHRLADALIADARAAPWACHAGCASCCHHPVGVTFAEAVALLAAIDSLPPGDRDRVDEAIAAAARTTAAVEWRALAGLACPLLGPERTCSAYAARPIACRAWGSTDSTACGRHAAGDAVPVPFDRDALATGFGVGAVLGTTARADAADPAIPDGHRELRAALAAMRRAGTPAAAAAAFAAARTAAP